MLHACCEYSKKIYNFIYIFVIENGLEPLKVEIFLPEPIFYLRTLATARSDATMLSLISWPVNMYIGERI